MSIDKRNIKLYELASSFRTAIEAARDDGRFTNDLCFHRFPQACCGDASDLLGEYLLEMGINTDYICGTYYYDSMEEGPQSHAWLRSGEIIIDITGDQFQFRKEFLNYYLPVYVGKMDEMHRLFDVRDCDIHRAESISSYGAPARSRLCRLYDIIKGYM